MTFFEFIQIITLLVDVIKVIIPFGFIFLIFKRFEKEIRVLIKDGGWKVSAPGVSIESLQKQQEKLGKEERKEIELLKKEVESAQVREKKLKELQEYATKDRETYFLGYHFEKTYRLIFPSQMVILNALKNLNGIPEELAMSIHRRTIWARDFNYTYDQFIGFLIQNGLLEVRENKLFITALGNTFMQYLLSNNIPLKIPANDQLSNELIKI